MSPLSPTILLFASTPARLVTDPIRAEKGEADFIELGHMTFILIYMLLPIAA